MFQRNKQYISDLIIERGYKKEDLFNDNYYSIIAGGVGTGKSTFICSELANFLGCDVGEILMTAPLRAISNQLIHKGQATEQVNEAFFYVDKVPTYTFNGLKNVIKEKGLSKQYKYVVFDEAHNLITAEEYAGYGVFFLKWLKDNDIKALFLSATPNPLVTYSYGTKPFKVVLNVESNVKVGNICFTTQDDLLNHALDFSKNHTFIAVKTVREAFMLERKLNEILPNSAMALISKYNEKATDEMKINANKVIKSEQFPEGIKFLIVTSAYIEGMELQTICETAIIKHTSVTAIVQAVGRLRQGVNDVIVVLSKDEYYGQTKHLYEEFNKFLTDYHKANELTKHEMLLGIYSVQEKRFGHDLVIIHGMKGYIPDYQINMPLYHSLEIKLTDLRRLYCEDGISMEQFNNLVNIFKPYFPDAKFSLLNKEGMIEKEENYTRDLEMFLKDLNGKRVYAIENKNGISIDEVCRKVMQLREKHIIFEKPVSDIKSLNRIIKSFGYKLGNRSSSRNEHSGKDNYYIMSCTQKEI